MLTNPPGTLPTRLAGARQLANKLSARELARLAGIKAVSLVGLIESGVRPNPESATAERLAQVLGCSLDWLIAGKGDAPTAEQVQAAVAAARARLATPAA